MKTITCVFGVLMSVLLTAPSAVAFSWENNCDLEITLPERWEVSLDHPDGQACYMTLIDAEDLANFKAIGVKGVDSMTFDEWAKAVRKYYVGEYVDQYDPEESFEEGYVRSVDIQGHELVEYEFSWGNGEIRYVRYVSMDAGNGTWYLFEIFSKEQEVSSLADVEKVIKGALHPTLAMQ